MLFVNKKYESLDKILNNRIDESDNVDEAYDVGNGFDEADVLNMIVKLNPRADKDSLLKFIHYVYDLWDRHFSRNLKYTPFRFDPKNKDVKICNKYDGLVDKNTYNMSSVGGVKFIFGNGTSKAFGNDVSASNDVDGSSFDDVWREKMGNAKKPGSWGECFEYIICDAFNILSNAKPKGKLPKSWSWDNYILNSQMSSHGFSDNDKKKECFENIYNALSEDSSLKGKTLERYNGRDEVNDYWKEVGHYSDFDSHAKNEAKTDICTTDGTCKISVKIVDSKTDKARLASSSVCDSLAIITTAITKAGKDSEFLSDFSSKVTSLLDETGGKVRSKFKDSSNTVRKVQSKIKSELGYNVEDIADALISEDSDPGILREMTIYKRAFNSTILECVKNDDDVKKQILIEALSGNAKFNGLNSDPSSGALSAANMILSCKEDGTILHFESIDDFVEREAPNYKITAAFKGGEKGAFWIVMSIL